MSYSTSILNSLTSNVNSASNAYYEATQSGGDTSSSLLNYTDAKEALSNYTNSGTSSVLSANEASITAGMSALSSGTGTSSTASDIISTAKQSAALQKSVASSGSLESKINSLRNSSTSSVISNATSSLTGTSSVSSKITAQSDRRIKLRPKVGISSWASGSILLSPLVATNGFVFPYAVNVTVKNQASYGVQKTTHANQDFRYYTNTPSQTFEISSYLTAQNTAEAKYMVAAMQFFSAVTKMHFGKSDINAGTPPPVLLLSGFGPYIFNDLPVIVESFTYSYGDDVDLVSVEINGAKNDVPTLMRISATVTVQNTPDKLRTFNWDEFVSGKLLSSGGWK